MKKLIFFLCVATLGLTSCERDEPGGQAGDIVLLRLDQDNVTSPVLPAGTYEHAVKFPTSLTSLYDGDLLTGIQVHMYDVPATVGIAVYAAGSTATAPGIELYYGTVSGLNPNSVNNIEFEPDDYISISRSDLWISVEYTTSGSSQVIGCDAGPRDINGDFLKDLSLIHI